MPPLKDRCCGAVDRIFSVNSEIPGTNPHEHLRIDEREKIRHGMNLECSVLINHRTEQGRAAHNRHQTATYARTTNLPPNVGHVCLKGVVCS